MFVRSPSSKEKMLVYLFSVFFLFSLAVSVIILGIKLSFIPMHIYLNPNEAWNGFQLSRLAHHLPLYPSHSELITNNYPPLSFYLYLWLHGLPGIKEAEIIAFGRAAAALSCCFSAILLSFLSFKTAQSLQIRFPKCCGLFSFAFFMLLTAGDFIHYFAMYDPQWTGEVFMLLGLAFFVSFEGMPRLLWSALFFMLAGLVKHNLVAAPLAVTIWIFFQNRRLFFPWCLISGFFLASALLACWALFGKNFFQDILGYEIGARVHSLERAFYRTKHVRPLIVFFLGLLVSYFGCLRQILRQKPSLCSLWFLMSSIAFILGFLGGASSGCGLSVYFDFALSICILSGPVFVLVFSNFLPEKIQEQENAFQENKMALRQRRIVQFLLLVSVCWVALSIFSTYNFKFWRHVRTYQEIEQQSVSALRPYLEKDPRIACQIGEVLECFWAGGDFLADFTWLGNVPDPQLFYLLRQHNIHAIVGNAHAHLMEYIASLGAKPQSVGKNTLYFIKDLPEKQ